MQQAEDFRAEAAALAGVLADLADEDFERATQFKNWTLNDVLGHLHLFDMAALNALRGDTEFQTFIAPILAEMNAGKSILESQYPWLNGLSGRALYDAWRAGTDEVADAFGVADPKARLKWVGPEMSALSSISARQMETWAHGQEVFDLLGLEREEKDRIRNIVHMGVNTFGWTFMNRGLDVPPNKPFVELTSPSGQVWTWNDPDPENYVRGSAVDFARVVTQVRNVDDTALEAGGKAAQVWMKYAQCFAGPPETPPEKGARSKSAG